MSNYKDDDNDYVQKLDKDLDVLYSELNKSTLIGYSVVAIYADGDERYYSMCYASSDLTYLAGCQATLQGRVIKMINNNDDEQDISGGDLTISSEEGAPEVNYTKGKDIIH